MLIQRSFLLQDKYIRAMADRANDKVRTQKEIKDSKLFGIQSFSKDLLKVSTYLR